MKCSLTSKPARLTIPTDTRCPAAVEQAARPVGIPSVVASKISSKPFSVTALLDPSSEIMVERTSSRGSDAEVEVEISLREAAYGVDQEVNVQTIKNCGVCEGIGGTQTRTCGTCGGAGAVRTVRQSILGQMVSTQACTTCGGRGRSYRGLLATTAEVAVAFSEMVSRWIQVPGGIDDGMRMRISGAGHDGGPGAAPGDLYVMVRVKEDAELMRDGDDLIHRMKVTFVEAALGAEVHVPTLDGESEAKVEPARSPARRCT